MRGKIQKLRSTIGCKALSLKNQMKEILQNEDGDTNFLSIIIILAIVLIVAVVFIGFKDKIVNLVNNEWQNFINAF